jgi:hypothetical protein
MNNTITLKHSHCVKNKEQQIIIQGTSHKNTDTSTITHNSKVKLIDAQPAGYAMAGF